MKTYIITLILFVWTIGVSAQNEEGIQFFHGTWEEALNEAKSQDKMLFVDVWASWCSPCKRMAAETFTQDVVGDYFNKHFVCYKLMIDPKEKTEKEKAEALMKNYQVNAFPTLLWIDCNGDMLHSSVGYKKADELIAEAKIAQNPKKRFSTLLSKWENGDHSLETALKYFSRYSTKSEEFDEYYLHLSPKEQCDTSMQMLLAFQMNLRTDSKIPDYIASHWEDQYKTAPKADFWTMFLRKSLRQQLSEYKNDQEAFNQVADKWREYNLPFVEEDIHGVICSNYFKSKEYDKGYEALDNLMKEYPNEFPSVMSEIFRQLSTGNLPQEQRRVILMDYVEKYLSGQDYDNFQASQLRLEGYVICGEKEKAEQEAHKALRLIENTPNSTLLKEIITYLLSPLR